MYSFHLVLKLSYQDKSKNKYLIFSNKKSYDVSSAYVRKEIYFKVCSVPVCL
jgi:hypothetical protein